MTEKKGGSARRALQRGGGRAQRGGEARGGEARGGETPADRPRNGRGRENEAGDEADHGRPAQGRAQVPQGLRLRKRHGRHARREGAASRT